MEYYGNKKNGVVLKFTEPLDKDVPDSANGDKEWRNETTVRRAEDIDDARVAVCQTIFNVPYSLSSSAFSFYIPAIIMSTLRPPSDVIFS